MARQSADDARRRTWRAEWGSAAQLADDLWRVRLKNPRGLLMVNTYVHRGASELVVVDPGWPWTLEALEVALSDMGVARRLTEVGRWLYTHAHIDHMGAAALLSRLSEAPHVAWQGLAEELDAWHAFQDRTNDWQGWAKQTFSAAEYAQLEEMGSVGGGTMVGVYGAAGVANAELVGFGDELVAGDLRLRFVDARGHGPHHGAFFDAERGWLFSGDVVIAAPTPISRAMGDDLATYLASVDRLEALDASLLMPGHGLERDHELGRCFGRSRQLQDEIEQGVVAALEGAGGPLTAYEIALAATADGEVPTNRTRWFVQLALVDAHLHRLQQRGQALLADDADGLRFSLA